MKMLERKNIQNILIYTQLANSGDNKYTARIAHDIEEDRHLIEAGFEHPTEEGSFKIFRKRK